MKRAAKIIAMILVVVLYATMAIGSGSSKSGSSNDVKTPASASSGGQAAEEKPKESESPAKQKDVTIEEEVLFDQGGVRITAKSFNPKGTFGPEIKLLIENESAKSVTVQARKSSVNGYMIETMFSAEVAAGKKANDALTFSNTDLKTAGITTIADMEFSFHIFDSETWDTVFDSDLISVKTSAAEGFEYSYDDSGDQVYSGNGVEIVVKGLSAADSWLGPSVLVYISNESGQDITVQARDVSVNGFMVEAIFSCDVCAGKHAVDTVTFMKSELEENDIQDIEDVELSFHIFNMDTWDTIVDTPPVTITFD